MSAVSPASIEAAARGIDPVFLHTPQYRSEPLSALLGGTLVCKVETLNPIGCFKGRGIDWWMSRRTAAGPVVCASAGNLGQAAAYSGRRRGVEVHVFVAQTANPSKVQAMERLGAHIHAHGRDFDDARAAAAAFADAQALTLLVDGRDPAIAEGSGTIAMELAAHEGPLDVVYAPIGNGALLAGVGAWFKARRPETRIVGVCAEGAPAMEQSWRSGAPVSTDSVATIADGIAVRVPVPESLPPLRAVVDDVVLVRDVEMLAAMRAYFTLERLVVEPAGAASLAAALAGARGKAAAVVVTGSNVSPELMRTLCEGA